MVTIVEYEPIACGNVPGVTSLPKRDFDSLLEFAESNADSDGSPLLTIGKKKGIPGLVVKATKYVGVIQLNTGTCIEILPKIAKDNGITDAENARIIFERMIRTVYKMPSRESGTSNLSKRSNILELFITRYVEMVMEIVECGMAAAYYDTEGNEKFMRGRLDIPNNIKYNLVHAERFYVHYQIFGLNRPENRIIKQTLTLLYSVTQNARNKWRINNLLSDLEEVPLPENIDLDFEMIDIQRNMDKYRLVLDWSAAFLKRESFSIFRGNREAFALLFPMDALYEKYIYSILSRLPSEMEFTDHESSYLFRDESNKKKVQIIPDIIAKKDSKCVAILDTKWKMILRENDVSQADIYQMYVYASKFHCENAILIYPRVSDTAFHYKDDDMNIHVKNFNFNLLKPNPEALIDMIEEILTRTEYSKQ